MSKELPLIRFCITASRSFKILKLFEAKVEAKPIPKFLFHYTDDRGFVGILEDGTLRFTDIFRQNDPSELRHGLSTAAEAIRMRAAKENPERELFATSFENFCVNGGIESSAHYLVCCFSAVGDDLGQWRAYGNNGQGYALGFEARELESAFIASKLQPTADYSSFPITYDDKQLREIQKELVGLLLPSLSLSMKLMEKFEVWKEYMTLLSAKYSICAMRAALLFKHEAYRNENEYRFLQLFAANQPPDGLKFIRRLSVVKGFRDFHWRNCCPGALRKVVIGPAADRAKAARFVGDCLRAYNVSSSEIEVEYSNIPYRS